MGKEQATAFLRKAEDAENNVKWADDPDVRYRWKEIAGAYRVLAARAQLEAVHRTTAVSYRLTA
jgi:hypothetical protein